MDFGIPWPINLDICPIWFKGGYLNKIWREKIIFWCTPVEIRAFDGNSQKLSKMLEIWPVCGIRVFYGRYCTYDRIGNMTILNYLWHQLLDWIHLWSWKFVAQACPARKLGVWAGYLHFGKLLAYPTSSVLDPDPVGSGFKSPVWIWIRNPDPAIEIELF